MSVSAIRDGLATRLQTISGLKVYGTPPESVREVPAALVLPQSGELPRTMTGGALHLFTVKVLVSLGKGWEEAQDQIDGFMALTGSGSVAAAIDGDATLGGAAQWARVARYRDYGGHEYAGTTYLGVVFEVEVDEG